jgi:hypothetical protein
MLSRSVTGTSQLLWSEPLSGGVPGQLFRKRVRVARPMSTLGLLFVAHLLLVPSVLDVDVDLPVGVRSGERLGSPAGLGTFDEYGGPTVLVFDGSLLACVLLPYTPLRAATSSQWKSGMTGTTRLQTEGVVVQYTSFARKQG